MPSRKLKKFCRLTQYLEQVDKDLYQAFDDLCLFGLFRVRGNGVTFLYPTNKAYRKKIIDHTYSNNPEKAIDMVKALVLLDYIPRPSEFKSKTVVNSLHLPVAVSKADTKEVELKSGHTLTVAKDFATLRADDPVAVYHMSGTGELPMTGEKVKVSFDKKMKKGGFNIDEKTTSEEIMKKVEEIYLDGFSRKSENKHIYTAIVSLIFNWASTSDGAADKEHILSKTGAHPRATFYSLMKDDARDYKCIINKIGLNEILECDKVQECKIIDHHYSYYTNLKKLTGDVKYDDDFDEKRMKLISKIPGDYKTKLESLYSNKDRLYIDLLSVFCKLFEDEEYNASDFTFFLDSLKSYPDVDSFFNGGFNTGFFHSIVGVFPYSDSFLFKPGVAPHDSHELPPPDKKAKFSVQPRPITRSKMGGNESGTFFGGVMSGTMGGNDDE